MWEAWDVMRYLASTIESFSSSKLVLLAGPRQVGKTTLGKAWLSSYQGIYLNWDALEDRQQILKRSFLGDSTLNAILFDEIHKYRVWKGYLKGLYDKEKERLRIVVTGSARLDLYQKTGESMLGRYELLRLHPYSVGELTHNHLPPPPSDFLRVGAASSKHQETWERLEQFGGFPEPYHAVDPLQHARWSLRRRELLIKEDLRELSEVKMVDLVEHLYLLLPDRVGAPLSLNSLREEVQVAFNTVSAWIAILDRLYISYRISPYHKGLARSLKKEQKLYLWDWSQIETPGARFENMVASHLLKSLHTWTDLGYGEYDLWYWRNREKEEVDFVVTNKRKPIAVFECKLNDTSFHRPLLQLADSLGGVPAIQLVYQDGVENRGANSLVVTASRFFSEWV
jgi:predicted AAA+ superfamily ATPase